MKAIVRERYCAPEELELREVDKPVPNGDQVLVRVHASSVNAAEWYETSGKPVLGRFMVGLFKPKEAALGTDYAGTVEAVGANVTQFKPGDEVFGGRTGAYAEYLCALADRAIALKPKNVSFEGAATVAIAGTTALQALRDHGQVKPGQKVLITGASGGVGTFAVQIAKALGAEVTAATRNPELARSLGADHVVHSGRDDYTRGDRRYDVVIDVAAVRSLRRLRRVLASGATVVLVGVGPTRGGLLGPLGPLAKMILAAKLYRVKLKFFIAKLNKQDMEALSELLESGQVKPVIDRTYPLSEVGEALRYLGEGNTKGKNVIVV